MLRSVVYVLGFTVHLLGCDAAMRQAGGIEGRPDAQARAMDASTQAQTPSEAGTQAETGATSPAASSQCDVRQCERRASDLAQTLMMPAAGSLTVKGGDCTRVDIVGVVAGMACTCQSSNGWLYIGPEGAGCFARGRAGDCLWDDSEFEACAPGDPACPRMCEELQKRYAADAAKSFDVEIRFSTCRAGSCHHVLRIEDACYADNSFESGRRYDCKLSDAEILEREAKAQKAL